MPKNMIYMTAGAVIFIVGMVAGQALRLGGF